MKWLAIVGGAFVVLALLGFLAWQRLAIDTSQPQFVDGYKKNFVSSCVKGAEDSISAAGKAVDDAIRGKLQQLCTCGADGTAAELQNQPGMSMSDMMSLASSPAFREKVDAIMEGCRQRIGGI